MRWTVQQVADALGVAAPAGVDAVAGVAGVSIDSRTVGTGELFIAIHGARHDGHAYVSAAIGRGAVAAVVARAHVVDYAEPVRKKLIAVDGTLAALQRLGWTARNEWRALGGRRRLAGITGSTGKTTTKEILAALLGARCRVLKNEGNLNNEYGVPLTLLRLEEEHDAAVIELGMSHRGEIAQLAKICEPEVGVVTLVAPVHLEFFASLEEIALAKRELIENLASPRGPSSKLGTGGSLGARSDDSSVAVLNADDARVMKFAEAFRGRVLTFGISASADFRGENIEERGAEGSAFDFVARPRGGSLGARTNKEAGKMGRSKQRPYTEDRTRLELPLVGRHNVMNALAALAAASVWGVGAEEAKRVFPKLAPAAMRGEVLKFQDGFTVINDCYNSNPVALASMIGLLASTSGYRRRILAAGEMLELGAESARLHREAGALAAAKGIDWIFGVQGMAEEIVRGAEAADRPTSHARFFSNVEEAAAFLRDFVEPGDVVLVKGSRGVKMERIVAALEGKFSIARKKLED
jgi:UDP-N-acetylmuramoyl-tripeptide--D-alanyl-D-alanine ligase